MKKLSDMGVEVIGVSGDAVRNQQLFKKANHLNYALLADEKGAVAKKFGVPVRKGGSIKREIDGKEETLTRGVTASRWTIVIDREGKIAHKNTSVNAAQDSKNVLLAIADLKKKG